MKMFSTARYRKRKVILFIAAFLMPLVFVVVAGGIDTFSKRQKATRNQLESNLWFSGKSALEQLENKFTDMERQILNKSNFHDFQKTNNSIRKITIKAGK